MKRFVLLLIVPFSLLSSLHAQLSLSLQMDHLNQREVNRKAFKHKIKSKLKSPLVRAAGWCTGYNLSAGAGLFALPSSVTHWRREEFLTTVGPNMRRAWTQKPVWDKDNFYINYVGHPYQGGFYYNTLRSQGVAAWKSGLFLLGQTFLWEYGFEAVKEHPSRQDLITTPIGGMIIGELTHRATLRMRRRGFNGWEKIFVTVFNPSYVLNNGYR